MEKSTIGLSIASLAAAATLMGATPVHASDTICTTECGPAPAPLIKIGTIMQKWDENSNVFLKLDAVFIKLSEIFYK